MGDAVRVVGKSIFESYRRLRFTMILTLFWWLCSLPLLTLFPASAGLLHALYRRSEGDEREAWALFKEGIALHGWAALRLFGLNLFVCGPGAVYFFVLSSARESMGIPGTLLMWGLLYVLLMWTLLQLYLLPQRVVTGRGEWRTLLKQAYLHVSLHPLHSSCLLLLLAGLTVVSVLIPLLLITAWPVLIGQALNYGVLHRLHGVSLDVSWRGMWKTWR